MEKLYTESISVNLVSTETKSNQILHKQELVILFLTQGDKGKWEIKIPNNLRTQVKETEITQNEGFCLAMVNLAYSAIHAASCSRALLD